MQVYLGLGSNLGNRQDCIRRAIQLLSQHGFKLNRLSPIVESPALLPEGAPVDWNLPYLNLAIEGETEATPEQLLHRIHVIQNQLGRDATSRWAPRPIDIDILLWGEKQIQSAELTIPHPELSQRGFVLTPLIALQPRLRIPDQNNKTVLQCSQELKHHIPLWMGIVNLAPDSFSDGGQFSSLQQTLTHIHGLVLAGAQIIDIGAESTRPGAVPLTPEQEWSRLLPLLEQLLPEYQDKLLRPLISIDTYHVEVAQQALEMGVNIINDVSGLTNHAMRDLACSSQADWVAMHHVSIPASREQLLPAGCDPVAQVNNWLLQQLEIWDKAGLDLNRIIFDPGIGFGKDALQSLKLLRNSKTFRQHGVRLLIGHSRKSFLQKFSGPNNSSKDLSTVGASLNLCAQGVDIIRVHNISAHLQAYRGWVHLLEP